MTCSRSASLQRQMTSLQVARSHSVPGSRGCSAYQLNQLPHSATPLGPRSNSMVQIYRDRENNRTVCTITFADDVTAHSSAISSNSSGGGSSKDVRDAMTSAPASREPTSTTRFRLPSVHREGSKMRPLLHRRYLLLCTSAWFLSSKVMNL